MSTKKSKSIVIHDFIMENFENGEAFRFDVLSGKTQMRATQLWEDVTDRDLCTIAYRCSEETNMNVSPKDILNVLQSNDVVAAVHPLRDYLERLPQYDPQCGMDFIELMSNHVRVVGNEEAQQMWKRCFKRWFLSMVQQTLNKMYEFRKLQPIEGSNWQEYIRKNFQALNGKIYRPYDDCPYLVMALMRNDAEAQELLKKMQITKHEDIAQENYIALDTIRKYFNYSEPVVIEQIETAPVTAEKRAVVGKDDLAVFIYTNRFGEDLEHLRNSKGIAIGLKDSSSALGLAAGFMQTKYVVLHNKSDLSVVYNTQGSPRLLTAKDVLDYHVVLKDCELYIVFDIDMTRNNLDVQIDTHKLIADSDHNGYDSIIRPIGQYII